MNKNSLLSLVLQFLKSLVKRNNLKTAAEIIKTEEVIPLDAESLRVKITERPTQLAILDWVEKTLRPLENDVVYENLCSQADFTLTTDNYHEINNRILPFKGGGAGHEVLGGHSYRDVLGVLAILARDPMSEKMYPNEAVAAIIAGMLHDLSTSIKPRYEDNIWECGHAEVGAWLLYQLFHDLIPEHVLLLACYSVAAHTHQLNDVVLASKYVRKPWNDRLFYNMGRPVRLAPWLTRFADRLDTNGVTLMARHTTANIEGSFYGGKDFSGTHFYELDGKTLKLLFVPEAVTDEEKRISVLQQVQNFANSSFKFTAYSQHDKLFESMDRLMTFKANQGAKLVEIVTNASGRSTSKKISVEDRFWQFLKEVGCNDQLTETVHPIFSHLFNELPKKQQNKWQPGIVFAEKTYKDWIKMLVIEIKSANNANVVAFQPLLPEMVQNLGMK